MKRKTEQQARHDIRDAILYYEEHQPGHSINFIEAIELAVESVLKTPRISRPEGDGFRSIKLRGFPHRLIFRIDENVFVVVAVAHPARRPGYWREQP